MTQSSHGSARRPASAGAPFAAAQTLMPFERPPPPAAAGAPQPSPTALQLLVGFMLNPGGLIQKRAAQASLPLVLGISGLAFSIFFFQAGLDRARAGTAGWPEVLTLLAVGALFGTIGVAAVAILAWLALKLFRSDATPGAVVRACALSYSPTLVYVALGLAANLLLGWRTAVAFGVTGVLWSLGPLSGALRGMVGGRLGVSIVVATLCGLAVLAGWAWLGGLV